MLSDGYGLIIRTNLVLTIRFCIPVIIRNNIIYGHNMNDGSMFGSLKKIRMTVSGKRINISLYILRQPPTVTESSLMKMQSMAVMCIK